MTKKVLHEYAEPDAASLDMLRMENNTKSREARWKYKTNVFILHNGTTGSYNISKRTPVFLPQTYAIGL